MIWIRNLKISNKCLSGLTLAVALTYSSFIGPTPAYSDSTSPADTPNSDFSKADAGKAQSDIAKLEEKFFAHTYNKDTWQGRLERVEKMVFGETKTGSSQERLAALLAAVPNLASDENADKVSTKTAQGGSEATKPARNRHSKPSAVPETEPVAEADSAPDASPGGYPAVTAIEKKIFGKDYSAEPVNQRLARLETNVFGKPSASSDLSDRVDRLKQKTGIDIARQMPSGSDWADDDESGKTSFGMPSRRSYSAAPQPYSDDDSFGSDTAQGGSTFAGSSMGAGFISPTNNRRRIASAEPGVDSIGLDQQVGALEREIFGKTYARDPLAARLNRLEASVFPQKKPSVDLPLPDRVKNLLAVIPISQKNLPGHKRADDDTDLSDSYPSGGSTQSSRGGLGKIISSLSNMMGSNNMTGGYPVQSGNYMTDPRTGFLIDTVTGNEINPATGAVVGHVAPSYGSGLGNYNSFGSFGNGFSPFGSPYGSPYGGGMGGMGSGMRFGFGGGRFGGF